PPAGTPPSPSACAAPSTRPRCAPPSTRSPPARTCCGTGSSRAPASSTRPVRCRCTTTSRTSRRGTSTRPSGCGGPARTGAAPAAVLLAALGVVLARLAGQADLLVGTPMVGPRSPAFEPLLGGLVDIAPLRLRPDPASTFANQVRQVRDELLEALAHPTVGPVPATQVLFEVVDAEAPALELPGVTAEPVPLPVPTPVD